LLIGGLLTAVSVHAAVQAIELKERSDVAAGKAFGAAGPYERIAATVYFRIDPRLEQNRGIVDLALAPVNAEGMVEFSSDLLVLRPRDPAKGNGTALIDVPNRGRILSIATFNRGASALDPRKPAELGDGFLMERGFTIVSIGWQWDVPVAEGRLSLRAPRLREPITGVVRAEFVPDKGVKRFSLGDRDHTPYPVADEAAPENRLRVRRAPDLPRTEIPRERWRFVNKTSVELEGGCESGLIYEVVYRGTGAVPAGLGFAAVRDIASFFKYGRSAFLLGDQQRYIKRTIAFGVSQTGRFLRHMIYEGFNQDEKKQKALDGVWAHVAGAGRGSFNHRFAQPSRDGQPLLHYSWPVDIFPFSDTETKDPLTGGAGSLLARVQERNVTPKIFLSNNSYEYWGRAASLIHMSPDASQDLEPQESTRIYFLTGAQHGAGTLPMNRTRTRNLTNPLDPRWAMRALLVAFHEWLKDGLAPPASVYPRTAAGELARAGQVHYPPTIQAPQWPRTPRVLDFGADFTSNGIITIEPPKEGAAYPILLPQVDQDGNERGGVRLPEIEVPLGVYTGWNLRSKSIGSSDRMIAFTGSFFPFSAAEITRRYGDRVGYLTRVRAASAQLARRRFLLESDVETVAGRAGELWDNVAVLRK
jgi:hypothetical protein